MKKLLLRSLFYLQIHHLLRFLLRKKVIILMYHGFTDKDNDEGIENDHGKHLHVDKFKRQLEYLSKYHHVISLKEFVRHCAASGKIPANSVVITVDDGYRSNYTLAYPLLRRFGIPATIFLTTRFVDQRQPLWTDRVEYLLARTESSRSAKIKKNKRINEEFKWGPQEQIASAVEELENQTGNSLMKEQEIPEIYAPLRWSDVLGMVKSGVISIGSHTHSHVILTRCGGDKIEEELALSKRMIEEKTGLECELFCYPNGEKGDFDHHTKQELKEKGYSCGLTTVPGFNDISSDVYELRRFGVTNKEDSVEFLMKIYGVVHFFAGFKEAMRKRFAGRNCGRESMRGMAWQDLAKKGGVCMVVSAYYPEGFGGGRQCRTLIQALHGIFSFYVLATSFEPKRFSKKNLDGKTRIFRVRVWNNRALSILFSIPQTLWVFLKIVRRIQIVHCHGITSRNLMVILLAKLTGKKVIQKFTSLDWDDPVSLQQRWRKNFFSREILAQADYFVGPSGVFAESFQNSFLKNKKIAVIPNGVDLERFQPLRTPSQKEELKRKLCLDPYSKIFLFVGFFSREKGFEDLCEVWREMKEETKKDLQLVLIGATKGKYFEIEKEAVRTIKREFKNDIETSRMIWIEDTDQIECFYQAADIFILPSHREGLPNSLLEAMACGLPVVATRLAGIVDFVIEDGKNGLLFEAGDRRDLKKKIAELLKNPLLAETLGKEACQTIRNRYDIKRIARQYQDLYQEMISCAG